MYLYCRKRASSFLYQLGKEIPGKWIIPNNVCHAVYFSLLSGGSTPIIVDIEPQNLELNNNDVWQLLKTNSIKGVVFVRPFGSMGDEKTEKFLNKIKSCYPNVFLVDDRCLTVPSIYQAYGVADMVLYSTGYSKVVDLGEGGWAFTRAPLNTMEKRNLDSDANNFDSYFKRVIEEERTLSKKEISFLTSLSWINHSEVSINPYMKKIETSLINIQKQKSRINTIYREIIPQEFQFAEPFQSWRFNIMLHNKEEVLSHIFQQGLFASKHYFPLGKFFELQYKSNWTTIHNKLINLFNDFRINTKQAKEIGEIIKAYGKPL